VADASEALGEFDPQKTRPSALRQAAMAVLTLKLAYAAR
jgi:hypothetical protein